MNQPWVCPKCGRVYAPTTPECYQCNSVVGKWQHCMVCGGYHPPNHPCPNLKGTTT